MLHHTHLVGFQLRKRFQPVIVSAVLVGLVAFGCGQDETTNPAPRFSETGGDTFAVGDTVSVMVEGFAGGVEVSPGGLGSVEISYTKWAAREVDLGKIIVATTQVKNDIEIITSKPPNLNQTSVDLEVITPPGSELVIRLGAGSIQSSIRPGGNCRFEVGAGSIVLLFDDDIGVTVDLSTGVGSVVVDFPVDGSVSPTSVEGTIGAGDEADIFARTGAGNIQVIRRTRPK